MKASIIVHHPQSALDRAETRRGQRPSLYQSQILCDPLWTFLQWRTIMYVSIDQNSGKLSSPPWWRPESNRERRVKAVPALPFPVLGCCKPRLPISQSEHSRSKFLTVSDKLHKLAMLSVAAKGGGGLLEASIDRSSWARGRSCVVPETGIHLSFHAAENIRVFCFPNVLFQQISKGGSTFDSEPNPSWDLPSNFAWGGLTTENLTGKRINEIVSALRALQTTRKTNK